MNPPLRLIACARTLMYNFGQGIYSPRWVYLDLCNILKCNPQLTAIPSFKQLYLFSFSFYDKCHTIDEKTHITHGFLLYTSEAFLKEEAAVKLNWLHNFCEMQELLFNFSYEEIEQIWLILMKWRIVK